MKRSLLKDISIDELLYMRQKGMSNAEIAKTLDVSYVTIYNLIGKNAATVTYMQMLKKDDPVVMDGGEHIKVIGNGKFLLIHKDVVLAMAKEIKNNEKENLLMAKKEKIVSLPTFDDEEEQEAPSEVLFTKTIKCCDCGNTFEMVPSEQKYYKEHGFEMPKRCPDCRKKRKQAEDFKCIDCGATFQIRQQEKEYYEKNNLFLPKRCPSCRNIKKKHNEQIMVEEAN